jgi:hypothetical protein
MRFWFGTTSDDPFVDRTRLIHPKWVSGKCANGSNWCHCHYRGKLEETMWEVQQSATGYFDHQPQATTHSLIRRTQSTPKCCLQTAWFCMCTCSRAWRMLAFFCLFLKFCKVAVHGKINRWCGLVVRVECVLDKRLWMFWPLCSCRSDFWSFVLTVKQNQHELSKF